MQDPALASAIDRALWDDLPPAPAPARLPLLAHYTSMKTLERIARSGELWFSNPLYMNDVDELRYGMTLGLNAVRGHGGLREVLPAEHYTALVDAYDGLHRDFDDDAAFDVYVFSCAEHDDGVGDDGLLSMWRGYGSDGNGVAIVFDLAPLQAHKGSPLMLRQVQYLSYEQSERWMADRLERLARELVRLGAPVDAMPAAAAALFERVKLFALFTKHRGFHEEREWRLVYLREHDHAGLLKPQLHYTIGGRGIEPRLRFAPQALAALGPPTTSLRDMVRRIILGPQLATPLALRSTVRMLELHQPAWAGCVSRSTTPYRAQR